MLNATLNKLKLAYLKLKYRNNYHEYYAKVMKERTAHDPKNAVGGMWEELGQLQFSFLTQQGLKPTNTMLDFGCGALRGGLHFIGYLETNNYWGIDISREILENGKRFLREAGLESKKPTLLVVKDLSFDALKGKKFDYILAQSVLSHMTLSDIEICFKNIRKVMHNKSIFFATYHDGGEEQYHKKFEDFYYPFSTINEVGEKYGLKVTQESNYPHPRNQKMLRITLGA